MHRGPLPLDPQTHCFQDVLNRATADSSSLERLQIKAWIGLLSHKNTAFLNQYPADIHFSPHVHNASSNYTIKYIPFLSTTCFNAVWITAKENWHFKGLHTNWKIKIYDASGKKNRCAVAFFVLLVIFWVSWLKSNWANYLGFHCLWSEELFPEIQDSLLWGC